jgi:hypothetical protein
MKCFNVREKLKSVNRRAKHSRILAPNQDVSNLPKNILPRRANHRHTFSIAELEPAPGTGRGLFEPGGRRIRGTPYRVRVPRPICRSHSPHVRAVIFGFCDPAGHREIAMQKLLVAALIAASFFPLQAQAQERAGSAALGAVSGAVVLGPVGAVAGAFIGYAAGPSIARSWGIRRSASRSRDASHSGDRRTSQSVPENKEPGARQQMAAQASAPPAVKSPEVLPTQKGAPPVQGFE